jgi:hypothetical protein
MIKARAKTETGAPVAPSLSEKIDQLAVETERFIQERVRELHVDGLPDQIIRQMICGNAVCECRIVKSIIRTRERDEEIAARQQ